MKRIAAKNRTAQLAYEAEGNPPSAHPRSAISNAYPGLEVDFRNIWRHILAGVELHEATNLVVGVEPGQPEEVSQLADDFWLLSIDGAAVTMPVTGPAFPGGPSVALADTTFGGTTMALEWSNALADVVQKAGQEVTCVFEQRTGGVAGRRVQVKLQVRPFFAGDSAAIDLPISRPGELTQSLCSPWQNDYRECACFYWASNRPDYVNVAPRADGTSDGNNWMQRERRPGTPAVYIVDDWVDGRLYTHEELFTEWEKLSFIIGGRDEAGQGEAAGEGQQEARPRPAASERRGKDDQ